MQDSGINITFHLKSLLQYGCTIDAVEKQLFGNTAGLSTLLGINDDARHGNDLRQ